MKQPLTKKINVISMRIHKFLIFNLFIICMSYLMLIPTVHAASQGKITGMGSLRDDQVARIPDKFRHFYANAIFQFVDYYGPEGSSALNVHFNTHFPNRKKIYGLLKEPSAPMDIIQLSITDPRNGALIFDLKNSLEITRLSSTNNVFKKDYLCYNTSDGEGDYGHICTDSGRISFDKKRLGHTPMNNSYLLTISNNGMWAVVQGDLDEDDQPRLYRYDVERGKMIDLNLTSDMVAFIPAKITDDGENLYGFSIDSEKKTTTVACNLQVSGDGDQVQVVENFRKFIHPDGGYYAISAMSDDCHYVVGSNYSVASVSLQASLDPNKPQDYDAFLNHPKACFVHQGLVSHPIIHPELFVSCKDSLGLSVSGDGKFGIGTVGDVVFWLASTQKNFPLSKNANLVASIWRCDVENSVQYPLMQVYLAQAVRRIMTEYHLTKAQIEELSDDNFKQLMTAVTGEIHNWRLLTAEKCFMDTNGDYWIAGLGVYYPGGEIKEDKPCRFEPYSLRIDKSSIDDIQWSGK